MKPVIGWNWGCAGPKAQSCPSPHYLRNRALLAKVPALCCICASPASSINNLDAEGQFHSFAKIVVSQMDLKANMRDAYVAIMSWKIPKVGFNLPPND